jgi:AcrR family transcriptional regulator
VTSEATNNGRDKAPRRSEGAKALARRRQILAAAAHLFAERGYDATSTRDIAAATGILGGSLYYHFSSKEELFAAVHAAGIEAVVQAVEAAVADCADPWDRLEAAAAAHCKTLLEADECVTVLRPGLLPEAGPLRAQIIEQRDRYERMIGRLVDAIPLPPDTDRQLFRLHLLGALNYVPTWYRPGFRLEPEAVGRQFARMLRSGCAGAAPGNSSKR